MKVKFHPSWGWAWPSSAPACFHGPLVNQYKICCWIIAGKYCACSKIRYQDIETVAMISSWCSDWVMVYYLVKSNDTICYVWTITLLAGYLYISQESSGNKELLNYLPFINQGQLLQKPKSTFSKTNSREVTLIFGFFHHLHPHKIWNIAKYHHNGWHLLKMIPGTYL